MRCWCRCSAFTCWAWVLTRVISGVDAGAWHSHAGLGVDMCVVLTHVCGVDAGARHSHAGLGCWRDAAGLICRHQNGRHEGRLWSYRCHPSDVIRGVGDNALITTSAAAAAAWMVDMNTLTNYRCAFCDVMLLEIGVNDVSTWVCLVVCEPNVVHVNTRI